MEKGRLVTSEQLKILAHAQLVLSDIQGQSRSIYRELPADSRIEWEHQIGIDAQVVKGVSDQIRHLSELLCEVEVEFDA